MTKRFMPGLVGFACLLCCAAYAEDSYQFSGTLDFGYYKDFDGKSKTSSISRSNIAFDAKKDLGSDLALTGRVNTRFFLRHPSKNEYLVNEDPKYFGAGELTVGLKSAQWGHLRVGRGLTALWQNDWNYDAWYNYDSIASPAWWLWHGNSPADPNASSERASFARINDGLFYSSPSFNGFSVDASYGTKKRPAKSVGGQKDVNNSTSVALKYDQKAYSAMFAHEKTPVGNTVNFLAGKVNIDKLSVMAAYDGEELRGGKKNRSYSVSARYTEGQMSYMVGGGVQQDNKNAKFFGAGASYAYKPNFNVYASYGNQGKNLWGNKTAKDAVGVGVNYSF